MNIQSLCTYQCYLDPTQYGDGWDITKGFNVPRIYRAFELIELQ